MTTPRTIGEAARAVTLLERIVASARPDRAVAQLREITGASDAHVRHVLTECALPYARERDPDLRWSDEMSAELSRLWARGLSLTAIGHRLGVSRNAVASKARRLDLPKRSVPANFVKGSR
jgi:hypothetical protein